MRVRLVLGTVAVGLLTAAAPAMGQQKIGFLDSRRVLQEAPGAQDARTAIQREMAGFEQRLQVLEDSVRSIFEDYQQRSLTLSAEARRAEEQRIVAKRNELQARAQQLEVEANQKQTELMQPVMTRVERAIEDVRTEGGYAFILDTTSGAIISADTTLDLTVQVIERLKAGDASAAARN